MRKSSNPSACFAALALLFAGAPALAAEEIIWTHSGSGAWDTGTSSLNWTGTDGVATAFTDGDAVVFGLDASGSATNGSGHITINTGTVTVGAHGNNPGVLIGSGSWFFDGGEIQGGGFAISGTTTLGFSIGTSGSGQRVFHDQRFEIASDSDFTLRLPDNNISFFTGSNAVDVDGGAWRSGANSNITLATDFAGFYYVTNTTSGAGGAIYAGGNLDVVLHTGYTGASVGQGEWNWLNLNFISNNASDAGGAIYAVGDVTMVAAPSVTGTDSASNVRNDLTPVFQSNTAGAAGGAIYALGNVAISGSAVFSGNTAGGAGGAIYSEGDVTLGNIATFASNTAGAGSGASGGAIHAHGDVTLTGTMTFANNTAGMIVTTDTDGVITGTQGGAGGAIYTDGNLTMSGSSTNITFYNNRSGTTASHRSSLAYVGGTFSVSDEATVFAVGGIAAQAITITSATLKIGEDYGASNSALTLTTIDAAGLATAGTISFQDVALHASYGTLAVNEGSIIEISGSAFTVNATGAGASAVAGKGTVIPATITGTAEFIKTGTGILWLTGTNTYTGATTVEAGTLRGNITDSSTLTINAGATYISGSFTPSGTTSVPYDRTMASLNGEGTISMSGATLTAHSGNFMGAIHDTSNVVKLTTGTLVLGSGTAGNLDISEGVLNIGGDKTLHISGTTTVAAGAWLGVNVSDSTALYTGALETAAGSVINITGVGNISSYDTGASYTVIVTDTASPITDRDSYTFLINGNPIGADPAISQFLTFAEDTSAEYISGTRNNEIAVATTLVWNLDTGTSAHGTFQINSGTFNLIANLSDNTHTDVGLEHGWDGKTLTKAGAGTLILSGSNTYTGTTYAANGTLLNNGYIHGDVATTDENDITGLFINTGTVQGDIYNAGNYVFQTSSTFIPDETDDPDAEVTGTTVYWNGAMNGNLHNTGTALVNLGVDYEWDGALSGDAGILIKTGTAAFTLNGDSTYSGTVRVDQGAYISGKAGNLDSVATYVISSASGTLSLGGYSHNLQTVFNNGILAFGPAATAGMTNFATATIANYTTRINDDGEHEGYGIIDIRSNYNAGLADRLIITGTASGTHAIRITNADNITPDKSRPYIPLITGDGVAASNTDVEFIGAVDVGMGRLIVARGDGVSILGSDTNVWYLASGNQASNVADAILSTASVAGLEWNYQLDTVRQRMGDLRQEALMAPPPKRQSPLSYTTVGSKGGNAWLRGSAYHLDADARITNAAFDEDVLGISFGYDKTYRWEDNQYLLGAFATISDVSRDFDTRGDGRTNSYGGGFYFSYLKDNGWYGDTSLLIAKNNNDFTTHPIDRPDETIKAAYSTYSWGLSIEVGKIIKNKKTGWWVEPSGQAALAVINGKTYATNTGMEVKMADANIYQFRAALRAGRDVPGTRIKPYVRAAAVNVTSSGGRIRAGNPDYPQYYKADMDGNRIEAGAGASWVIDEKSQLYLDYEYAKADHYSRPWAINFGFRSTW